MICRNCGTEFEGNYCPECGTRAEGATTPFTPPPGDIPGTPPPVYQQPNDAGQQSPPVNSQYNAGKRKKKKKKKKPFFLRWWFILIVIFIVAVFVLLSLGIDRREKIEWSKMELGNLLPEPPVRRGILYENSDESLWVSYDGVSDDQYNDYLDACKEKRIYDRCRSGIRSLHGI